MNIIDITKDNLEKEHICCAISDKKGEFCVSSKKAWLKERFDEGLVFKKLDARGKVFIEYIPSEKAWCPITAPNFMHINCFWVSGQYKGQGYANELLSQCIADAKSKGKSGITVLSSTKKLPFLSDPSYLKHKGFIVADTAQPSFELLYLPFTENINIPHFNDCAKKGLINEKGIVLYYSNQCPHTEKYAPLVAQTAQKHGIHFTLVKVTTVHQAQNMLSPFTSYSLFYKGRFVTNEVLSEKKFEKILEEWGI